MIDKGALAGMIVGIVAGIAILAAAIWYFWRRHKRSKAAAYGGAVLAGNNEEEKAGGSLEGPTAAGLYKGLNANTSELHNEQTAAAVSARSTPRPGGSELAGSPKPVLPVRKPVGGPGGESPAYGSEFEASPKPIGSELAGNGYAAPGNELSGSGYAIQGNELPGSGYHGHPTNVHEAPGYGQQPQYSGYGQQQQQSYGQQGYGEQGMYGTQEIGRASCRERVF